MRRHILRGASSAFAMAFAIVIANTQVRSLDAAEPLRIGSGVSGHIHPAACVTNKGTVLVMYSQTEARNMRLSRSEDGGKTFAESVPFPHTQSVEFYPGSLTSLADGRIVHAWNAWYKTDAGKKSRFVQYSVSTDDGKTWAEPKSLAKGANDAESVIRHPVVEIGDKWLMPLMDRTVLYDPKTGQEKPLGDGRNHGLTPIVKTPKSTLVSGIGLRSTDVGKTWAKVSPFPAIRENGWRFEMIVLKNGWLVAGEVIGPGVGGEKWRYVVSRDDGQTWDFDKVFTFYDPGRAIGGRACPRTVQLDDDTLGTAFYDTDAKQPGGSGMFFLRIPLSKLK